MRQGKRLGVKADELLIPLSARTMGRGTTAAGPLAPFSTHMIRPLTRVASDSIPLHYRYCGRPLRSGTTRLTDTPEGAFFPMLFFVNHLKEFP